MPTIRYPIQYSPIDNPKPNLDYRYGPWESEDAYLDTGNIPVKGLTIGISQEDGSIKEMWYVEDPEDSTNLILVEKDRTSEQVQSDWTESDPSDPAFILNKPTISDGGQGSPQIPLSGNVKVTASTASGETAGVTITQGQRAGEIEMQFTLPKGNTGDTGDTGEQGPAGPQGTQGKSAFVVWKEATGKTDATEAEYIEDLQTKVVRWIPVAYEATAASASIGDTVTFTTAPSNPIDGAIVLMPNAGSGATASMMFAVSSDGQTPATYTYTYIGDMDNVDVTGLLGSGDVDGTGLKNPTSSQVAKAEDVMPLAAKLEGVTASVIKVPLYDSGNSQNVFTGYVNGKTGAIGTNTAMRYVQINVDGWNRVRFLGRTITSHDDNTSGFAFGNIVGGEFVPIVSWQWVSNTGVAAYKEYLLDVPSGATVFRCTCKTASLEMDKFYLYLQRGGYSKKGVVITTDELINSYLNINYVVSATGNWTENDTYKHGLISIDPTVVKSILVMTNGNQGHVAFLADADNYPIAGATTSVIGSRTDLVAAQCIELAVPSNARYIEYTKSTGTATPGSITLCVESSKPMTNYGSNTLVIGCARMSTATGQIQFSPAIGQILKQYGSFMSLEYDSLNMELLSVDGVPTGGVLTYYCLSKDKVMLGSTTDPSKIPFGTAYIRFGIVFSEIPSFKSIILTVKYRYCDGFSPRLVKSFGLLKNPPKKYLYFAMEIDVPHIDASDGVTTDYYRDNIPFENSANGRDYTQATIYPAKNYDAYGSPTKTIVYFHGTTTYQFTRTDMPENLRKTFDFYSENGYNVIDVSTSSYNTNKLFATGGQFENATYQDANYPTPLSWSCYNALFKRIKAEFNVEQDGFYFLAKSAGGMNCVSFIQQSGIVVKAAAIIAGGIDVYTNMITVGSTSSNYFLSKIGCDDPALSSGGRARKGAKSADALYLKNNSELINLYNPFFKSTEGFDKDAYIALIVDERTEAPVDYPYSLISGAMTNILQNAKRYIHAPVKIWHSVDDNAVPVEISEWFSMMCNNAGCHCELRKWPAGHGRHYIDWFETHESTEFGDDTTEQVTVDTPFGGQMTVPVCLAEVRDFFNRY